MKIEDIEGRKIVKIKGVTTINHEVRVRARLSCMGYVMMVYLENREQKKEAHDPEKCFSLTGFGLEEQRTIMKHLKEMGYILDAPAMLNYPALSSKWYNLFRPAEVDFENFWKIKDDKGAYVNAWPGSSREESKKVYLITRKQVDAEYLLEQRDYYFQMLDYSRLNGFDRAKMGCPVFLNIRNKKFSADWKKLLEEEKKKYLRNNPEAKAVKQALTQEEIDKQFNDE